MSTPLPPWQPPPTGWTPTGATGTSSVAVAAVGRLGDAKSVPVLVACIDSGHLDVVDAALQALADMAAPEAHAALLRTATEHGEAGIRQRAADLLRTRRGTKDAPK